jgi:Glyoxalase/Bleomycin resistance protein/Dioxygenase superfamily
MALFTSEQISGRKIIQVAYTVQDLERAALHWATAYGAGPFFLFEKAPVTDVLDRDGNPGVVELGAAVGQWGPVQVELIRWDRVEPGPVADALTAPGFNHVAYFSTDPDAEADRLEAEGVPLLVSLKFGPATVRWHDGRGTTGSFVEHFPCDEAIEGLFRMVAEAAEGWDGSDPVRGAGA